MVYKIISWNVNGLRACEKKGFWSSLNHIKPDIIGLQEIKAKPEQLSPDLTNPKNYHAFYAPASKPGYSGVGLLTSKKIPPASVRVGMGIEKFDFEGRVIIGEYNDFFLINAYFPNGRPDLGRVPFKLEFSKNLAALAISLKKRKPVILCGDVNTAHEEIDIARPKENAKNTGFLPVERDWISEFLAQGFIDIFRYLNPYRKDSYTWWSARQNSRARNIGWRIDYIFISPDIISFVKSTEILNRVYGSDHCPILLTLQF